MKNQPLRLGPRPSGGFEPVERVYGNNLGALRSLGFIDYPSPGPRRRPAGALPGAVVNRPMRSSSTGSVEDTSSARFQPSLRRTSPDGIPPVEGLRMGCRDRRFFSQLALGLLVLAEVMCITFWPPLWLVCLTALLVPLAAAFVAAALDCRDLRQELELAVLRRRAMFSEHRPLTKRERQRLERLLNRHSARIEEETAA